MVGRKDRGWTHIVSMHRRRSSLRQELLSPHWHTNCFTTSIRFTRLSAKTLKGNLATASWPMPERGTGWVFLHLSPLSSRLYKRIKVKKVKVLLRCLWSCWAGNSELQSNYLLNSFQAELPVTFERRNNVSSGNAAFGTATERGWTRTPPNASLMYVSRFCSNVTARHCWVNSRVEERAHINLITLLPKQFKIINCIQMEVSAFVVSLKHYNMILFGS